MKSAKGVMVCFQISHLCNKPEAKLPSAKARPMSDIGRAESRGVPHLLSLLVSSVERAAEVGARNTAPSSLGDGARHDDGSANPTATAFSSSSLRIRGLRRAYNIILFGGPSHADIISQSALEDRTRESGEPTSEGAFSSATESDGGISYDTLASVSAVSLELRGTRRYDPANALESLVEELLFSNGNPNRHAHDSARFVVRVLRLLLALRGQGGQARGADDWEILGRHSRRVLERLYSRSICGGGEDPGCREQQIQQQQRGYKPTSIPVAMFFRGLRGGSMQTPPSVPSSLAAESPCVEGLSIAETEQAPVTEAAPSVVQQQYRYLLPDDCVLHGDSIATDNAFANTSSSTPFSLSGTGITEHMSWFTGAEFASERGIPSIRKGMHAHALHCTAPLSPAAWTRLNSNADVVGGNTSFSCSIGTSCGSGGAPATPVAATADALIGGGRLKRAETVTARAGQGDRQRARGRTPLEDGHLDLCGALSQARVDPRSVAVRELRLALSFPDLVEGQPPDLVQAVNLQQPRERIVNGPSGGTGRCRRGDGDKCACSLCRGGVPRNVFSPCSVAGSATSPSLRHAPRSSSVNLTLGPSSVDDYRPRRVGGTAGNSGGVTHGVSALESLGTRLKPVGWERTESKWDDSSFPECALACAPLVTAEGGGADSTMAFEVCYRDHFGWAGVWGDSGQGRAPVATEAEVVRKALAVLQGVPSSYFWFDEKDACMRVTGHRGDEQARPGGGRGTRGEETSFLSPRVASLSPAALSSLLKEFAKAGTWYRRVEDFAACLVDRFSTAGQVAHAFGIELRRQLTAVQSAVLGVTPGLADAERSGPDILCSWSRDAPTGKRCCSLTTVLLRTARLRRAAGALAEICGLYEDDLGTSAGVRPAFEAFPRGASLLTYLYKAAEVRMASKPGVDAEETSADTSRVVMGDRDSALSLLSSAAAPYLSMLARWLWSGEMRAEDDPHKEFPLRQREAPVGVSCPTSTGRNGGLEEAKAPWMENGGGSFMTIAFCENEAAGVPCFLGGGVLAAAAQAGKLLRMLKLSSPEFYAACSASPPPPLSLVFGSRALASRETVFERLRLLRTTAGRSAAREVRARAAEGEMRKGMGSGTGSEQLLAGQESALGKLEQQRQRDQASVEDARRIWVRGLERDRAAAAAAGSNAPSSAASIAAANAITAAASAEKTSAAAVASGGRGVLSFLNPPTSEAEAFAAAAITERYRLLGEEADARATRARWKRRRSARMVSARASLNMLYAKERQLWQVMAAEGAASAAKSGGMRGDEVAAFSAATDGVLERKEASSIVVARGGSGDGGREEAGSASEKAAVEEVCTEDGRAKGNVGMGSEAAETSDAIVQPGATVPDTPNENDTMQFSFATIVDKEGGQSAAVLQPINTGGAFARGGHAISLTHDKLAKEAVKFSPVTIVDEPGGKSVGVSAALDSFGDEANEIKFSHVRILQEPGGKSCGVSGALSAEADGLGSGKALAVEPLPGRSGARRIVQEPGGNSYAVASTLGHGFNGKAAMASRVGDSTPVEESKEHGNTSAAFPRPILQECDRTSVGASLPLEDGADVGGGGTGRSLSKASCDPGSSPHVIATAGAEGSGVEAVTCDERTATKRADGWSRLQKSNEQENGGGGRATNDDTFLPLEMTLHRCVRNPILAQCAAVDSAALAFLVRDAGVAEHLASLRTFLLSLTSDFLHDFTLRLLDGLHDGGLDWRRPANLDAAVAASASATGLDSVILTKIFRYEVDPTCAGVLGARSTTTSAGSRDRSESTGAGSVRALSTTTDAAHTSGVRSLSSRRSSEEELYSPTALSFVSPVLEVKWPVGVLLQTGVLYTYGAIHRSLFRHQLALHRLRRLRVALRELDAWVDASSGGVRSRAGRRMDVLDGDAVRSTRQQQGTGARWDRGRIHWLHLFRHEMQHLADSLQNYFAEQAEAGWPDLHRSLSAAREGRTGGGLAALVAAHSRYISRMHSFMFLGTDRQGAVARARIGDFYGVVCTVSRITDGLLSSKHPVHPSPAPSSFSTAVADLSRRSHDSTPNRQVESTCWRGTWLQQESGGAEEMILPDEAFAQLAAARETFDAARRGLCEALIEICDAGGGARARPLLSIIGYGGYGGDDL